MTLTDYMYQERKGDEDSPALKTMLTHRYNDYREKHEGGLITAIRNDTDNTMADRMTISTRWNDKIVVLKKTTLQLYFKTFIEKINSANLIM